MEARFRVRLPDTRFCPQGAKAVFIFPITWGHPDNVSLTVYRLALRRALGPGNAASEIPIVLDPSLLRPAMERAGFDAVRMLVHEGWYPATSGEDLWRWMRDVSPGYASLIAAMPVDDRSRVHDAVLEVTRERYGDRFEALPMESLIGIGS